MKQDFFRSKISILVLASLGILPVCSNAYAQTHTIQERLLTQEIFVRGGFNGWGSDNRLTPLGNNVYQTQIMIPPGYHGFKIAPKDWSTTWIASPTKSVSIDVDKDYALDEQAGPENYLFVKRTGLYQFTFDISKPPHATLHVVRLAAAAVPEGDPHAGNAVSTSLKFATFDHGEENVKFSIKDGNAALRSYTQSTSVELRDPGPQWVNYHESANLPYVRTGNLAFDALFALAGDELQKNSVSEIKDGNYNDGNAIACHCFETGEKWHYVWTRDLSYAATLGLALIDPVRVKDSLEFKLAPFRHEVKKSAQVAGAADGFQIVQDTGSGGSWPVSTDRVTWAFGAEEALKTLPEAERKPFAVKALKALITTLENDRLAVFDPVDGLYSGEQSFLDWRDQTYAAWIVNDIASLASAKALSTNVAHYKALSLAAALAKEQGKAALAKKYSTWAEQLRSAINQRFWLEDAGLYSSLTAGQFDGAPMYKFDWLGQSLAIITGIADQIKTQKILAHYPHGPMGAPVIYPQQAGIPIYHNRAIWPFVTAFGLKAASIGGNTKVADEAYKTLIRGAALNLSNMENLEWLSGQAVLLDEKNPSLIGPVINSKRQLWSVGAYLGMVIENVFGVATTNDGISLKPFITSSLRREQFPTTSEIVLHNLSLHGHNMQIQIHLPVASDAEGYYAIDSVTVNQQAVQGDIKWSQLSSDAKAENKIEIQLGKLIAGSQEMKQVEDNPYEDASQVFAPYEPTLTQLTRIENGTVKMQISDDKNGAHTFYNIYRNGLLVARSIPKGLWKDLSHPPIGSCYAVEAVALITGNHSHHSSALCVDPAVVIPVTDRAIASNIKPVPADAKHRLPYLKDWGKPTDQLKVKEIVIGSAGHYLFQLNYLNTYNEINLGITCGVKWAKLTDHSGKVVAQGVIQMPHTKIETAESPLNYSTALAADLFAGSYSLELSDFYNMSYLQSNSSFSNAGGKGGPVNRFDIYAVRVSGFAKP